jgi:hypothetical protein
MRCKSCGSVNQKKSSAEMGIHFLGLKNIDKPVVWVFPEVVVCLDCGAAEFAFLRPNCANSQRETPLRQVNLELSLTSH